MRSHRLRAAAGNAAGGIPTDGLVAWYTMDSVSGSTLVDEQGTYDGTITGATQAAGGVIGQALSFDGDDRVVHGGPGGADYSLSLWLKTATTAVQFVATQAGAANPDAYRGVYIQSDGLRLVTRSSGGGFGAVGPVSVSDDAWHHVVAIQSGTVITLYADNIEIGSHDPGSVYAWDATWYMGVKESLVSHLVGALDQYRLYNRALTAAEVAALYSEAP